MNDRRVVITGLGAIAPNGIGKEAFWKALIEGRSGIGRITRFDPSKYSSQVAGEVRDFDPAQYIDKKECRRMGRATQFAAVAARMALADAGLQNWKQDGRRMGVFIGHTSHVMDVFESGFSTFLDQRNPGEIDPFTLARFWPHAPTLAVAHELGCEDSSVTLATNCCSGLIAIGYAYRQVKYGEIDIAVAGGAENFLTPYLFGCLCSFGILSQNKDPERASRPFDLMRDGGVYAEGAGVVILEALEKSRERRDVIYGEISGFVEGNRSAFAQDEGLGRAISLTLTDANLSPIDLDYISAHGPSHPLLDRNETLAIKQALGDHAYRVPISSIKSMIGNPGTAAGPLQLIASLLAIQEEKIPPTINYEYPDPECDLDYVPNKYRLNKIITAMIISQGGGGMESCMIVTKL